MIPNLVYNSILSWANGWYFLIASEIIAAGPGALHAARARQLPRPGAITVGRNDQMLVALLVLLLTTVAMHLLVWSPLETWARAVPPRGDGGRGRARRVSAASWAAAGIVALVLARVV